MTERSIAELIGWRYDKTLSNWVDAAGEIKYDSDQAESPTADDLLAWLREQGAAVWPGQEPYDDSHALTDVPLSLCVARGDADTLCLDPAPTLLAALEAAVRAVAGES